MKMYSILKGLLVGLCFLITLPFIAITRIFFIFKSNDVFDFCGCFLSLMPGLIGSYLRVGYYKGTVKSISKHTYIGFCSFFSKPSVEIGKYVTIGSFSIIGDVIIEDEVLVSSRCSIMSSKNQHEEYTALVQTASNVKGKKITIGSHSWIGENSVVMADIGNNSIVSSGSVVNRDMPANVTVVGNPARPLPQKVM